MNDQIQDTIAVVFRGERARLFQIVAGTAVVLLSAWMINDKRRWLNLDTGGSPPNWYGYLRMTRLRIVRLFKGGRLSHHTPLRRHGAKYLRETIEPRQGPRPKSREWALPQRLASTIQLDPEVHARIFSWTKKFPTSHPDTLEFGLSGQEGFSAPAVFVKKDVQTRPAEARDPLLGYEIFHAHAEDSSLHVWLSEADLKTVVSRGWGERMPLSAVGRTHPGFGFVYTPRTMAEADIVEEILEASVAFHTGQKSI